MAALNPTTSSILGSQDLVIPAGLKVETPEQRELYRASLEFERFFVQSMVKQADASTSALGSGEEDGGLGGAGTSAYKDMTNDQLVQSMLDGGGLGIASAIYTQMAEAAGLMPDTAKPGAAVPAEAPAPATPSAPATSAGGVA